MSRSTIKNNIFYFSIALIFLLPLVGCSSDHKKDPSTESEFLVKINNNTITLQEFNDQIKFEAYIDPEMDLTAESKQQFLDYLIRKQLMIQMASELKLDRNEDFVRTIEKYWESTLIRKLLEQKTEEFKKNILITDDEIKEYYAQNKADFDLSLDGVKETIRKTLELKELEEMLKEWNIGMRESANIVINRKLLQKQSTIENKTQR